MSMKSSTTWSVATALALVVAVTGCGSDDDHGASAKTGGAAGAAGEEDPGEHACEHVSEVGAAVTAAPERDSAPELSLSEEPYTIAMPTDGTTGFVKLSGSAHALVFAQEVGEVTGLYQADETDSILPEGSPNEFCPDQITEHFHLDLAEAGEYALELTSAADTVWLILIGAEGHAHGGEV
jgi:hypothetical protein